MTIDYIQDEKLHKDRHLNQEIGLKVNVQHHSWKTLLEKFQVSYYNKINDFSKAIFKKLCKHMFIIKVL